MSGSAVLEEFGKTAGQSGRATQKKHPPPLSIRFTDEERARLSQEAGKLTLSAYIRQKLFGADAAPRKQHYRRKRHSPTLDHEMLARLLATFGQSELGTSMIALALAAQSGALPVTGELTGKLEAACEEIREMRTLLIVALGVKATGGE